MGEALSELMHYISNTVLFCIAVVFLVLMLSITEGIQSNSIEAEQDKGSVTVDTVSEADDPGYLNMTGYEVFTDILNLDPAAKVYLNSEHTQVNPALLDEARRGISASVERLRNDIHIYNTRYYRKYRFTTKEDYDAATGTYNKDAGAITGVSVYYLTH